MNAMTLLRQGLALQQANRPADAERLYKQALALAPREFAAHHLLGTLYLGQGRADDALRHIDKALAIRPGAPEALANQGLALVALRRFDSAVDSFDRFLAVQPDHVEALHSRAMALAELGKCADALAGYDAVLARDPAYAQAWFNRGMTLWALGRTQDALASYESALAHDPQMTAAHYNRGHTLQHLGRQAEALAAFETALADQPDHVEALYGRGVALWELGRQDSAHQTFQTLLRIAPEYDRAFESLAHAALHLCDWPQVAALAPEVAARVQSGQPGVLPFTLLGYCNDAALQLACNSRHARKLAEICAADPQAPAARWNGAPYAHDKIRIAYLSGDFHYHATALLTAELFERHDRTRFAVTAISFGPDDGSAMRARLMKAFDDFVDVRGRDDRAVAALLGEMEIDIAVDLGGYTMYARPGILCHRPCPVQVSYLGFPATMGADWIDYVIADAVVLPPGREAFFTEQIVRLPGSYQVNDSTRTLDAAAPPRRDAGLPDKGFVFCCFNNGWKITAPVFAVWMRLLAAVDGSVLWLLETGAADNLRRAAAAQGIDPARLVFAPRVAPDRHLARHRLADLFLDTLPYNAHTTASDALWAGVPLVTCPGTSFSSRVAASLLTAIALPELIAPDLPTYEALALALARDPQCLALLKSRLAASRRTAPLFDTARFTRGLEQAYEMMWDRNRRGAAPQGFDL